VDDGIYVYFFNVLCIECAAMMGIEAIFMIFSPSALGCQQDPILFDKLEDMVLGLINHVLGHIIGTHHLSMDKPTDFLAPLWSQFSTMWGPHCWSFMVLEAETLAGQLEHASFATPWLKHLMPHVFQSLAVALQLN
jgi:hypothetical protein